MATSAAITAIIARQLHSPYHAHERVIDDPSACEEGWHGAVAQSSS